MWLPWKKKKRPRNSRGGECDRNIFEFRDGAGNVCRIDPLAAWCRFVEDSQLDPTIHFDQLGCDDAKMQAEATRIVAGAARRVFLLPEFASSDPASLTNDEVNQLLWTFIDWVEAQKKTTGGHPISLQPTASAS